MRTTPKTGEKFKHRNISVYEENFGLAGEHYGGKTHFAVDNIALPFIKAGVKVWFWNHHGKFLEKFDDSQICYYLDELENRTQIYVPESKSIEHFNEFCKLVQEQRNLHVILDELHDYVSAQSWKAKELQPIIRDLPANQNVTYTAIFQRISEVQRSIMGNAKYKFLFKYDSEDQEKYNRIMGSKASLLLENSQRRFHKKFPICKPYSFLFRDEEKSSQTEFYNGGKFVEVQN